MEEEFTRSKPYTCWGTNCNARVENISLPGDTKITVNAGTNITHTCGKDNDVLD